MKVKSALCFIMIGVGGTIMYQQLKNGELKNTLKKMDKTKMKIAIVINGIHIIKNII